MAIEPLTRTINRYFAWVTCVKKRQELCQEKTFSFPIFNLKKKKILNVANSINERNNFVKRKKGRKSSTEVSLYKNQGQFKKCLAIIDKFRLFCKFVVTAT